MANEMHHALQISNDIIVAHESSPPRLWHPRFSWSWLGVAPSTFILDERTSLFKEEDSDLDPGLSASEARQGIAETFGVANITKKSVLVALPIAEKIPGVGERPSYTLSLRRIHLLIPLVWRFRSILRLRLALSKFIRSTQHSSHLRHALKNSIGVALLGFPAFLPINSSGKRNVISDHTMLLTIPCLRQQLVHSQPWSMDDHHFCVGFGDKHRCNMASGLLAFGQQPPIIVAAYI